jgi:diaminopimelate epimerase
MDERAWQQDPGRRHARSQGQGDAAGGDRAECDPETQFDQIMAIHDPKAVGTDAFIDILNSDGSKAQACGNGTRCVVQALAAETGKKASPSRPSPASSMRSRT